MLYPQNGDRIVTIDSVTSLHPMYMQQLTATVTSVCSASYVRWRGTAHIHPPHAAAAERLATIDRYLLGRAHDGTYRRTVRQTDGQTDGQADERTPDRCITLLRILCGSASRDSNDQKAVTYHTFTYKMLHRYFIQTKVLNWNIRWNLVAISTHAYYIDG